MDTALLTNPKTPQMLRRRKGVRVLMNNARPKLEELDCNFMHLLNHSSRISLACKMLRKFGFWDRVHRAACRARQDM